MKSYNVIEYTEGPDAEHTELDRQTVQAADAAEALRIAYPQWSATYPVVTKGPDRAIREGGHGYAKLPDCRYFIEAEPADPEDLAPKPQSPEHGALREALARALVAEHLCEAAMGELARVAGITQDQAYIRMIELGDWTPGDAITDDQCEAFLATPQEPRS